jgi:hypothetical protein
MDYLDVCPGCDEVCSKPVSERMLGLFKQFKAAHSAEDRLALTEKIAEVFLEEHDFSDAYVSDLYHQYFEEFQKVKVEYAQGAARLSRLAIHVTETYLATTEMSEEDLEEKTDTSSN